ncbi:hypothetical protein [Alicyclobacillus ferrooxydans]|uniref:Uncharacterized protein n=1 Tax=Alicyclobacillus ferrooxydans TaxID=471514 RepID=A0A0P9CIQ3_9BACL|nr:hypothetical protein [Alicyclobacillus ferrooxydans]KPV45523.1 hypothetical protein AN477_00785 [Alicyclobacillus ferrooxydans]
MESFVYCLNCDCLHLASEVKRQFSTGFRRINGVDYALGVCNITSRKEALTGHVNSLRATAVADGKPAQEDAIGA